MRPFTLLEILLVASLLALIGGVVAIPVTKVIEQARFRSSVDLLENKIRIAEEIVFIYPLDLEIRLKEGSCELVADKTIPEELKKLFGKFNLPAVQGVVFNDQPGDITLEFKSGGFQMSHGELQVIGRQERHTLNIGSRTEVVDAPPPSH